LKNYIIGYGSLLKKSSLKRTLPEVDTIHPIYLKNYQRSWNAIENMTTTFSTTFLGIEKDNSSRTNAIIFEVDESMLSSIDKREFLYTRESVDANNITFISKTLEINKNDKIWIYITNTPAFPSKENPIIQSYVDTCISGCFEIEKEFEIDNFAKEFVITTKNWSENWVNDRLFPRAPHIYMPDAYRIDKLLNENFREYFLKIEIE
jgi:hypothetical protein